MALLPSKQNLKSAISMSSLTYGPSKPAAIIRKEINYRTSQIGSESQLQLHATQRRKIDPGHAQGSINIRGNAPKAYTKMGRRPRSAGVEAGKYKSNLMHRRPDSLCFP